MKLIKNIINYVYNKKIFYLLTIKTSTINKCCIYLFFLILSSCSLINTINELELKVVKVGKIDFPANYILIYPENYNDNLSYMAIVEEIVNKFSTLGLVREKEKAKAKYAFIIKLDFLNTKAHYNNELSKNLYLEENIFNMNNTINNSYYNIKKTFIFEAYIIHKNNIYNKVFEGSTIQIDSNKNIKELDKGILGFVLCSIDALFDKAFKDIATYQEYYYQCL